MAYNKAVNQIIYHLPRLSMLIRYPPIIDNVYIISLTSRHIYAYFMLKLIEPVQLPLHEPYFDLTLIAVTHTKNPIKECNPFYMDLK